MPAEFNILAADAAAVSRLREEFSLPSFVATTLVARGFDTVDAVKRFLTPSLERDWLDPYIIPGMNEVVDSLYDAVRADKTILVFGDFDLDGISATATLTRALRVMGVNAIPFIPLRFEEGYGLSEAAVKRAMTYNPDVVVTVDNGIACADEAPLLAAAGIELLVTDHHEPADLVPTGVPVADPKIGDCPSSILSGAGVALKVVQALGARLGQPHLWREYVDLVTLGTIADLMPMRDENRALVAAGIATMNDSPRPCIAALLAQSRADDKPVSASNLSFSIIPRLNAAGRMGNAQLALDVLMADGFDESCKLAAQLESVNEKRRSVEAELVEVARVQAAEVYHGQRALVVSGENWHEGVKGIVASRLVNKYGVPAILFSIEDGQARGSGRSVGSVNLFKAVESTSDLLIRFGGHEAAVGVTLPAENLPEFQRRLCAFMDELPAESFHPRINIDACVDLSELSLDNVAKLDKLAPFGQENKSPRFLARNVFLSNTRAVGVEKNHFSCNLTDGKYSVAGIMFHATDIDKLFACGSVVDAAFELQIDHWRGRNTVKAMLSQITPVTPCAALEACLDKEGLDFVSELYAANDEDLCQAEPESLEDLDAYEAEVSKNREYWHKKAIEDPAGLRDEVVHAIIGDADLYDSQRQVLDELDGGKSVLAVMGTSRGKSLTFFVHATTVALAQGKASVFVYPLRALIADQSFHIDEALQGFGIRSVVLTGESSPDERKSITAGLNAGEIDIVLTTPEYLDYHAEEIASCGRIGFAVIDEAHHIGLARAGQRLAYKRLGESLAVLGNPPLLALTATASDRIAEDIRAIIPIDIDVFDPASRDNLIVDDQRNLRKRENYLANLVAEGEKTVIYVNSREQSVSLARHLRKLVPQMAPLIGFYNAGLSRLERKNIEKMFRDDALCVLVATAAFGEGVNIPNIRHVVLYHLPFNEIEFNQMSGRAGRDGHKSVIHLLFGRDDAAINDAILRDATPGHDDMAQVYRQLKRRQTITPDAFFPLSNKQLAEDASSASPAFEITVNKAICAVSVFRELGLIDVRSNNVGNDASRDIKIVNVDGKVELTDSVRYREGLDEIEIFMTFKDWALKESAVHMQSHLRRPMLPSSATEEEGEHGKR